MDATQIAERIVSQFLMPALALGTDRSKWHERSRDTGRAAAMLIGWAAGRSEGPDGLVDFLTRGLAEISARFESETRAVGDPAGPAYQMTLEWFCKRVKEMAEVVR